MEKATLSLNLDTKREASGRLVPTIIFIVLPIIYVVWGYHIGLYNNWNASQLHDTTIFYMLGILIASVVYGFTALRHIKEKSFKNRIVVEFEYVKKMVEISYLAVFAALATISTYVGD